MLTSARVRFSEWTVLLLLAISLLWKGGKGLESTWLLAGLASLITIGYWLMRSGKRKGTDRPLEARQGIGTVRGELPLSIWVIALLYIGVAILSYAFSRTSNYGLDEVLRSIGYILLFLWAARLQIEEGSGGLSRWFPVVITGSAVVAGIIGCAVYILQPVNRFVGTFFDSRFHTDYWPNAWAEFLLIVWPMALLLAWRAIGTKKRVGHFVVLGFILSTFLLSYSRGAMMAMAGQCAIMAILFAAVVVRDIRYKRLYKTIIRSVMLNAASVIMLALALFTGINALRSTVHDVQSVTQKLTFTAAEGRSSIDERAQFWEQAWLLAWQQPVIGWGPYSFRFVQPQYMKHVLATSDHPHNVLLKFSMERGFAAAILFATLFGTIIGLAILTFFTSRKSTSPEVDAFTIITITSLTGLLLHNFIDYNLQFTSIGLATVLCVGLLVAPAAPVLTDATVSFRRWRIRKYLARVDVAIALMTLLVCTWEGAFLITSSLGRHALAAGDGKTAMEWFERSHYALFTRDLYLSEAQLAIDAGDIEDAQNALDAYESRNSYDARLWKLKGDLYMRLGESENAVAALERAYALGKYTDLGMMRMLLESLRRTGKADEYAARKLEFDSIFSAYAEAIEQNIHFIALSQNVEELQAVSRILGQMYPVDDARYKTITRSAVAHAKVERARLTSRTPGMLW